ncbi:hypothetical protein [Terracidiphilus sp.]|uniref:hypothetical protein n=1 Tax=Terracidiphilus sp. TaxID=1964191 RepID=UPI003C18E82D
MRAPDWCCWAEDTEAASLRSSGCGLLDAIEDSAGLSGSEDGGEKLHDAMEADGAIIAVRFDRVKMRAIVW